MSQIREGSTIFTSCEIFLFKIRFEQWNRKGFLMEIRITLKKVNREYLLVDYFLYILYTRLSRIKFHPDMTIHVIDVVIRDPR